jgi:hypothetical protein
MTGMTARRCATYRIHPTAVINLQWNPYMAQPQNSVEEAMNRVLETERAAHDAVAECERQAADLLDAAQRQAHRVHTRTDARISQVHARCSLALGRQVDALLAQESTGEEGPLSDEMREILAAAVARLAESLTDAADTDD